MIRTVTLCAAGDKAWVFSRPVARSSGCSSCGRAAANKKRTPLCFRTRGFTNSRR